MTSLNRLNGGKRLIQEVSKLSTKIDRKSTQQKELNVLNTRKNKHTRESRTSK